MASCEIIPENNSCSSLEVKNLVTEVVLQTNVITTENVFGLDQAIDDRFEILIQNSGIPSSSITGLNSAIDDRFETLIENSGIPSSSITGLTQAIDSRIQVLVPSKALAKAWITFDSTTTPITIKSSYNILSVTDNGIGDFTINFLQPFQNSNYTFTTWSRDRNTDNFIYGLLAARSNSTKTPNSVRLINNVFTNGVNYDSLECNVIFFGD